nr:Morn repeat protein [Pandoravirus massiliensis]
MLKKGTPKNAATRWVGIWCFSNKERKKRDQRGDTVHPGLPFFLTEPPLVGAVLIRQHTLFSQKKKFRALFSCSLRQRGNTHFLGGSSFARWDLCATAMASRDPCNPATCDHAQQECDKHCSNAQPIDKAERAAACHLLALPDELLVAVLAILSDPAVLACAAPAARRLGALCRDDALWRPLYKRRFGEPLHEHFAEFGKDWRWLYRARATRADPTAAVSVGCASTNVKRFYVCGDLSYGLLHGYGLQLRVTLAGAHGAIDPREVFGVSRDHIVAQCEGQWVHGVGGGRMTDHYSNADRYEGDYDNDSRHGNGVYIASSGRIYRGGYHRGTRLGTGVEEYPDGRRYEGEWDSERHGEGTMTLSDGRCHRGRWSYGKPHGWGVHTWPNGQRAQIMWRNGMPHGQGILTTADGRHFVDEARVVLSVGGAVIPADADTLLNKGNVWDAHLRRMRVEACADGAHRYALAIEYIDGSRLFGCCGDNGGLCSRRIAQHSTSCTAANRSPSGTGDKQPAAAAPGLCMACLCDVHAQSPRLCRWYLPAAKS